MTHLYPRMSEGRRKSHVQAEQKRRQAIRASFDKLSDILPGVESHHARSEAVVIGKCVDVLHQLQAEREALKSLTDSTKTNH